MKLIIVSGLSGSGKSVALHVLEDLDYYCIDNLPIGLLPALATQVNATVRLPEATGQVKYAVGIDVRNTDGNLEGVPAMLRELRGHRVDYEIFFLDANNATLLKRFSETRRKHPLSSQQRPLEEAIQLERQLLEPLTNAADLIIDTSLTNVHQLRDLVRQRVVDKPPRTLSILFESFGYKHGVPADADFVFDVRCLPNPHWEPRLRALTGHDKPVAVFLENQSQVDHMYQDLIGLFDNWLPHFEADNRHYMTIAIGCTGGQHRSVYLVERLAGYFRDQGRHVLTRHRELS